MDKIFLIIRREYLTRVKKKSFLIMTILGPILMAALFVVPVWLTQMSDGVKTIGVVDDCLNKNHASVFEGKLRNTKNLKFEFVNMDINVAKQTLPKTGYDALLYLPESILNTSSMYKSDHCSMYSNSSIGMNIKMHVENEIRKVLETHKAQIAIREKLAEMPIDSTKFDSLTSLTSLADGISEELKHSAKSDIQIKTVILEDDGTEKRSSTEVATVLSFISGFLIYTFIFMFGTQVMRGVIEEKTSRIVEVIISSVRPFQLMMGKIIGVAMVGLTQFVLWIILTFSIVQIVQASFPEKFNFNRTNMIIEQADQNLNTNQNMDIEKVQQVNDVMLSIGSINFVAIISMFLFYFLAGYLFYAALFAAVGAAVDSETDTQQFMLPITMPMIVGIISMQFVINNPQGPVAYWLSIIPFTSPIIMMARLPFGVPVFAPGFDLLISMAVLILGILFNTWVAAKIYRTGILMYGKKVNYAELWKWIRFKG